MRRLIALIIVALIATLTNGVQQEDEFAATEPYDFNASPQLFPIAEPPDAAVDIIAVHGMDGHWKRSWTANNGAFWLKDFLPEFVPRARIYSFGYDGRRKADEILPFDIADHGRALISILADERQITHTTNRPIIFIGHSLGGIVIKSALTYADNTRSGHLEHHKAIQLHTHAVIYFGTPHQGSDNVDLLRIISRLLEPRSYKSASLLDHLRPHSQFLRELQNNYLAISSGFETTFFFETLPTSVGPGIRLILVPEYSAVISGTINSESIPLRADHITLVKYAHKTDPKMQRLGKKLLILASRAAENAGRTSITASNIREHDNDPERKSADPYSTPREFRLGLAISQRRNHQFMGRESELSRISTTFSQSHEHQCNVLVLFGIGGIGKTQLALEFAYRAHKNFSSTFWIDGSSEKQALSSVRSILRRLENHYKDNGIDTDSRRFEAIRDTLNPQISPNGVFNAGDESETAQSLRSTLLNWLSYPGNRDWLLIMDNVDDLESFDFSQLLPTRGGSVLITSRRPDLTVNWKSIEVAEMDKGEALQLLEEMAEFRLDPNNSEYEDAQELNAFLGYLPLAITQAGAFLKVNHGSIRNYLDLYHKHPTRLLNHRLAGFAWNYRNDTVLTTWEISYHAIHRQLPEAVSLLHRCGFLELESITDEVLMLWIEPLGFDTSEHLTEDGLYRSINLLLSYSFLRRDENSMSMHPLVHLWARERLQDPEKEKVAREVLQYLYRASISGRYIAIGSHVNSIANFYLSHYKCSQDIDFSIRHKEPSWTTSLMQGVEAGYGWYLLISGKIEEWSTYLYRRWSGTTISALEDWELLYHLRDHYRHDVLEWVLCRAISTLGRKHIRTLVILGNYAWSLVYSNRETSHEVYTWLYDARKQVLGKKHSATIGALLEISVSSSSCKEALESLRIVADTRARTEGIKDSLAQNAIRLLQSMFHECSFNEKYDSMAVEWNLQAFQRYISRNMSASDTIELLRVPDSMILKMASSMLNTSSNIPRQLLQVVLSRSLNDFSEVSKLSRAIEFILRHYNNLYPSTPSRLHLLSLAELRWNDVQGILGRYWENKDANIYVEGGNELPTDQYHYLTQTFSTCIHTRLVLLMVSIYGSLGDASSAQAWLQKIRYPGSDARPKGRIRYYIGCTYEIWDLALEETYYHPLLFDIMGLLGSIHRGIEDAPLWLRWDKGALIGSLLSDGFFPFEKEDITSTAPFLQGWSLMCYLSFLEESTEILQWWVSKYHVCPAAFLRESLLESLRMFEDCFDFMFYSI